jgi:hypothetical protein
MEQPLHPKRINYLASPTDRSGVDRVTSRRDIAQIGSSDGTSIQCVVADIR